MARTLSEGGEQEAYQTPSILCSIGVNISVEGSDSSINGSINGSSLHLVAVIKFGIM
jgi:hypothetical protein